jgi:hypothetical protein
MPEDSDAGVRIARIIAGLLFLQLSRIQRRTRQTPMTTFDDFSVGYIFGFIDVMAQRVGIVDEDDAVKIFVILAKALFGREIGDVVCARFVDRQDSPDAVLGASTGRNDSRSWLRDPTVPPLGWYNYCRSESGANASQA